MKVCPTCQRCYEDQDASCTEKHHAPLITKRTGTRMIDGRYRLDVLLGRGGMGAVYKCTHLRLKRPSAIKLLLADSADADPNGRQRLQREALIACSFDHPNVVRILDFGANPVTVYKDGEPQRGDELYIVMELLEGETLREYLRKTKPVPPRQAVEIALQIADGLAAVHLQGVLHRDLKPANIMLTRDYHGRLLVKIVDFGSVKLLDNKIEPDSVEFTGAMMVGSAPYTSPENCMGLPLDQRSDIYCLGLILYEMLASRRAFESSDRAELIHNHAHVPPPPLADVCPDVPPPLAQLVMSALEKNPGARPQSADEFARILKRAQSRLPSGAGRYIASSSPKGQNPAGAVEPEPNEETRVADRTPHVNRKGWPGPKERREDALTGRTIVAGMFLLLFLLMSAFFIKTVTEGSPPISKEASPSETPATQPIVNAAAPTASGCSVGQECVTTTDANLRAQPGKANKRVGLAEAGSRVRVLKIHSNWREVVVLEHGREKEDPESADQGWLDGSTLRPAS